MDESEFHRAADAVLARIEAACSAARDLDADIEAGILTIECPDGSKVIVNKQAVNREIWVAARSGGFHYRSSGGAWRDTRSGEELFAALANILAVQAGERVEFG
ncbi:MAG: iron donor protein CyaY [Betaproteobacteria bacterium]|nr:iron donor protein CyaY [Betaproteobacteria bacterium]